VQVSAPTTVEMEESQLPPGLVSFLDEDEEDEKERLRRQENAYNQLAYSNAALYSPQGPAPRAFHFRNQHQPIPRIEYYNNQPFYNLRPR